MRTALHNPERDENDPEMLLLGTSLGSLTTGLAWLGVGLPLPRCAFHALTGMPCPTCGATRCALALLHGHAAEALAFNPLAFVAFFALLILNLYAAAVLMGLLPRIRLIISMLEKRYLLFSGVVLLFANWAWLIYHGV
jgi:hypothetical protein